MSARAKTINLLLYEGDLGGVISIEDSSWNAGELYSAPRESVDELIKSDACSKYGVYMLLSQKMVYVGQSSDLAKRISQHIVGKDWWESVVVLTTKDDSFDHSDIDYLESVLIEKAQAIGHLDCDNKNKGNNPKVSKFRKVFLEQYLEEALFLMQLIGINVFSSIKNRNGSLISTLDIKTKLTIGKRAKTEAIQYLRDKGIFVGNKPSYAVKQPGKDEFWINPQTSLLNEEWYIILNNNEEMELIVLQIPANSFVVTDKSGNGLIVRSDKPDLINLKIRTADLRDKITENDFSVYEIQRIKY